MSILPSQAQGSKASSSSQPVPQNAYPNHDNSPQSSPPSALPIPFGSLHISDPPPLSLSTSPPGTLDSDAHVSAGPSKGLSEVDTSNAKRTSVHRNRRTNSHSRGKMSEDMVSTRNQGTVAHEGTTHPAGKRTQMTNFNDLLNFHYDPIVRSRPQIRGPPPRRQRKIKPYNKDLFLQANFKFVVLDTGNYAPEPELMDPDKNLLWEDIVCVRYSTPFPVQCPICLEHPQCPQITSCGHIFCFPCILQYLFMGEEDQKRECFKRCPLCFVMVSQKDLYTIYIENVRECCVGNTIEFMLLSRQKDSFVPSQKSKKETSIMQCGEEDMYDPFSKFIFTSDVDLSVRQAISDLDSWLARADSGLVDDLEKLPYVCAAMEQLEQRKKYWKEHRATDSNKASINTVCKVESDRFTLNASKATGNMHSSGGRTLSSGDDENNMCIFNSKTDGSNGGNGLNESAVVVESVEVEDSSLSNEESKNLQVCLEGSKDAKNNDYYNFYQAVDGQHIILHPLNVKCLLHHYGNYDFLPHRVSGRILELETVTQSEAVRRRYRYLSHFSLTTTFQLCEIDLSGILPSDALLPFMDEIKRREKQRKQLARKEQKEKIKAEVAAAVQFTPFISGFGHSSYNDSPSFSMEDFEALGSSNVISSSPPITRERKLFSNVTRLGFAAAHDSPSLKIEEGNGTQKNEVATDSPAAAGSRNSGTASFANVISRATAAENLQTPKMSEMEKKGKKGGRVLLSTAGGRRY
ncbi:RING finger protein 10-like isoform X2 [Hibiscus syriacus]|uniref:RING finger protein 10-like isoform X2 n=1 Tax=Hibiscus syriacus TaxID=106335 RepID=UPI001924EEB9|nr:RING finger protein 10-like isoform X2 [Hibiscus syriacus]